MWCTLLHVGRLSKMVWHLKNSAPSTKPSTKKSTAGLTLILTTLERLPHQNRLCEFVAIRSIATSMLGAFAAAIKHYYCNLYTPWLPSSHSIASPELLRKSSGGCTRGVSLLRNLWNSSFVSIAACEYLSSCVCTYKCLVSSQFAAWR